MAYRNLRVRPLSLVKHLAGLVCATISLGAQAHSQTVTGYEDGNRLYSQCAEPATIGVCRVYIAG